MSLTLKQICNLVNEEFQVRVETVGWYVAFTLVENMNLNENKEKKSVSKVGQSCIATTTPSPYLAF